VDACVRAATVSGVDCIDGIDGEIFNIATGLQTSNEAIVDTVEALAGRRLVRAAEPFPSRPWDSARWVADTSKTERVLGWRATTSLRDGLDATLRWFQSRRARDVAASGRPL
jgi:nucleoside-diphosphate-sugar epimerase